MKNIPTHLIALALTGASILAASSMQASETVTGHERTYILPDAGNHLSLDGTWQLQYPVGGSWNDIQVPGEVVMQGYAIEHDKPFLYRKEVSIPADYAGNRIILRFDGVYSEAVLSVNGKTVRKHKGGFTRWETDVTDFVTPGRKNEITLEVTDRADDISFGSGYAHHPIGGILRSVTLYPLPTTHLYDVNIETHFDAALQDATLKLSARTVADADAEVTVKLTSPTGKDVTPARNRFALPAGETTQAWQFPIAPPLKWDAEHPHLYTLNVSIRKQGEKPYSFTRKVGFRQVKITGRQMLVNGQTVKLRGACRHDMHPTLGRTTTAESDSLDALLFKEANMNFVRTSHYPPTERFLDYCDRYGIYVECETAVCFQNRSMDAPEHTAQYLSQMREMVKNLRTHASIIIWSIGNESRYGENFYKSWEWVKEYEPTRPVIFSWPGHQRDDKTRVYDIVSIHYPSTGGSLKQKGIPIKGFEAEDNKPALFDEWAHPACYTYKTLQNDPNIREFWGESIDKMWSNLLKAPGGLGGGIWGYIDETFMVPPLKTGNAHWREQTYDQKPKEIIGNCVGYGEWGIVDVWRRKKPEFWATKKAYSPIRLQAEKRIGNFSPGKELELQVYNHFDHSNLREVKGICLYRNVRSEIEMPSVSPHRQGTIILPAQPWTADEKVKIEFYAQDGSLIDAYQPVLGSEEINFPEASLSGKGMTVSEDTHTLTIRGKGFEIPFDKQSGLITRAKVKGKTVIEKGPYLHHFNFLKPRLEKERSAFALSESDWKKSALTHEQHTDHVIVKLAGTYGEVSVSYRITVKENGGITVSYQAAGIPNELLHESGIAFHLPDAANRLKWKRNGYWGYYPDTSFAANEGDIRLYNEKPTGYRRQPQQPWAAETHEYFYRADAGANCSKPLTRAAKGMKEHIYYYTLAQDAENILTVISHDASVACRLEKRADSRQVLYINNRWDYPDIAWGNHHKRIKSLPCEGTTELRF